MSALVIKYINFYGSYLANPFLISLWYIGRTPWGRESRRALWGVAVLTAIFIWARFFEPGLVIVRETDVDANFFEPGEEMRIGVIADLHVGIYKDESFVQEVVDRINELDIEYVFIPGDFIYEVGKGELDTLLNPLKNIQVPVYGVLGNHDFEPSWASGLDDLRNVLKNADVTLIDNKHVVLGEVTLVGLGSRWFSQDDVSTLDAFSEEDTIIVLAHNPDTTLDYTNDIPDITITGHTHCGQIRIPWLYKLVIPVEGDFDKGLTKEKHTQLYITCGVGEIGLPMRLFNPPVIDVLTIK